MGRHVLTASERLAGARKGGKALVAKSAPADCAWCREHRYVDWHQHIGHLGFAAYRGGYMDKANRPSIRWKLKCTARRGK